VNGTGSAKLLGTELSGPEIARELSVSLNTVRTHTKNIYSKLGTNNRRAAVAALKNSICCNEQATTIRPCTAGAFVFPAPPLNKSPQQSPHVVMTPHTFGCILCSKHTEQL